MHNLIGPRGYRARSRSASPSVHGREGLTGSPNEDDYLGGKGALVVHFERTQQQVECPIASGDRDRVKDAPIVPASVAGCIEVFGGDLLGCGDGLDRQP